MLFKIRSLVLPLVGRLSVETFAVQSTKKFASPFSLVRDDEFQGELFRLVSLLIPEKFPGEVFSKIKSEAYLSANLLKPVLAELLLLLVRSFAFCPGGPPRICFLVCFLVYRFWIEISLITAC